MFGYCKRHVFTDESCGVLFEPANVHDALAILSTLEGSADSADTQETRLAFKCAVEINRIFFTLLFPGDERLGSTEQLMEDEATPSFEI